MYVNLMCHASIRADSTSRIFHKLS